jgi:hypothetical protein
MEMQKSRGIGAFIKLSIIILEIVLIFHYNMFVNHFVNRFVNNLKILPK